MLRNSSATLLNVFFLDTKRYSNINMFKLQRYNDGSELSIGQSMAVDIGM